jgi:hypothetical protein
MWGFITFCISIIIMSRGRDIWLLRVKDEAKEKRKRYIYAYVLSLVCAT